MSPLVDVVVLAGVGLVLWWGWRSVTPRQLQRFSTRFGVELGEAEVDLVGARLRRGRVVRSIGVAAGVLVTYLPVGLGRVDPGLAREVADLPYLGAAWIFGAAAGALVAEVVVVQRPIVRRATVVRREPSDYVSAWLVRLLDGLVILTLGLAATARDVDDPAQVVAGAAMVVVAWSLARLGLRTVVDRPRLAPSGRLADVDDALRALGAHHVVGPALAVAGG
ncbi:MAG: hypothetical protein S0880_11400, partial [Actinomycetota bacterium]|nr:hypothetical protein [Actinomycetota bacterium]